MVNAVKPNEESNEKIFFFDAGPIISLMISRLIEFLPELKKQSGGKFYITPAVRKELVERPLSIHRFEFEALQVMKYINDGVLEIYDQVPNRKVADLSALANNSFSIKGKPMDVIQSGEMESVASALELGATVVMDERTLRLFIEKPTGMAKLLEGRFRSKVVVNKDKMKAFQKQLENIQIIRSIELAGVAYKMGLLDSYIPQQKDGKSVLVESVLYATKYGGCAVTENEIEEIKEMLLEK